MPSRVRWVQRSKDRLWPCVSWPQVIISIFQYSEAGEEVRWGGAIHRRPSAFTHRPPPGKKLSHICKYGNQKQTRKQINCLCGGRADNFLVHLWLQYFHLYDNDVCRVDIDFVTQGYKYKIQNISGRTWGQLPRGLITDQESDCWQTCLHLSPGYDQLSA